MPWDDHGGDLKACTERMLIGTETAVTNRRPGESGRLYGPRPVRGRQWRREAFEGF